MAHRCRVPRSNLRALRRNPQLIASRWTCRECDTIYTLTKDGWQETSPLAAEVEDYLLTQTPRYRAYGT